MQKSKDTFLVVILGLMVALGPFSIDMYLPAFKIIAAHYGTSIASVGLSMASYFVGMAAGQLLYGPLLDRFGRKPPLYAGLIVYLIATVACIYAADINQMILYRFIQALGGCSASVAGFAMVRDIFPVKDNAKIFSSLMLVISASPVIAPSAGAFVGSVWGWQSIFIALIGICFVVVALVFLFLPESKGADPSFSLHPRAIIMSFSEVIKEPQFFTYAISGGISFAGLFVFVSNSPFLYMTYYGLDEKEYGILFAVLVGGMIAASQSNRLMLRWVGSDVLVSRFLWLQLVVSIILLLIVFAGIGGMLLHSAFLFLYLASVGIILPNSSALTLAPFSSNTGTASSLMGVSQLGFGAFSSFLVSTLTTDSAKPMAVIMFACAIIALSVMLVGRQFISQLATGDPGGQPAGH